MIPVENLYYMLCYAWNRLEERDLVSVKAIDSMTRADLFASVLVNGTTYLLRKGIDQKYRTYEDDGSTIKGRLDIGKTVRGLLHIQARAHCTYDDLSHNVLRNQILKTTLGLLIGVDDLASELKYRISSIRRQLVGIDDIFLSEDCFRSVRIHRLDLFYDFLIHVCELIHKNLLVSQYTGSVVFRDFMRNEREMAVVFEEFVRNFYARHLDGANVKSEMIKWDGYAIDNTSAKYLPQMRTDTSISYVGRKIVIDTKYYVNALQTRYDKDTIISSNLYQINAYLHNLEHHGGIDSNAEGILLYPVVGKELHLRYKLLGHNVTVATINLNQPWQGIHSDLLSLIDTTQYEQIYLNDD